MRKKVFLIAGATAGAALLLLNAPNLFPRTIPAAPRKPHAAPAPIVGDAPRTAPAVSLRLDKAFVDNYGTIDLTGTAPAGKPVYIEVWSSRRVRESYFDSKPNQKTGKRPFVLYTTTRMPAFYRILVPIGDRSTLAALQSQGESWSYAVALKDCGAQAAFRVPDKIPIKRYRTSLLGSLFGSHEELLPAMNARQDTKWSMQLVKDRFRSPGKIFVPDVETRPSGSFSAKLLVPRDAPAGKYEVRAVVGPNRTSSTVSFQKKIVFPYVYLGLAGMSINIFYPFLLTLLCTSFAMLLGGGGGALLNPLLILLWPLPQTVVAGTVLPTVLFSEATGIYNYSKIKFINWRLGISIGLAMLVGAFIGPKLTGLITPGQFRSAFGWVLLLLAVMMLWQTTPWYLTRNRKERVILQKYRSKAREVRREAA